MAVEAVAVIAAVSGVVGTINILTTWLTRLIVLFKAWKESGTDIQELYVEFKLTGSEIAIWQRLWGVEGGVSTRYLQELWGDEDLESVLTQLTSIQALCTTFEESITSFLLKSEKRTLTAPHKHLRASLCKSHNDQRGGACDLIQESRSQPVTTFLDTAVRTRKSLSVKKLLRFITLDGPKLKEGAALLRKKITNLKGIALSSYNSKHAVGLSGAFSVMDLEPAKMDDLLRLVRESQEASRVLYESCCTLSRRVSSKRNNQSVSEHVYIEMDLIKTKDLLDIMIAPSRECLGILYHLLLTWPENEVQDLLEVLVEGPLPTAECTPKTALSLSQDGLMKACNAAVERKILEFHLQHQASKPFLFRSGKPSEGDQIIPRANDDNREDLLVPLNTLLYNLWMPYYQQPPAKFPLPERYQLALQVVEYGLVLSGTSWFSGFRMQRLSRTQRILGKGYRYVFDTSSTVADLPRDDHRSIQQHIFSIGKLLVEIATGHAIVGLSPSDDDKELDYEMLEFPSQEHAAVWTSAEVLKEVTQAMGQSYSAVAEFCLGRRKLGSHWIQIKKESGERLQQAYHEVLKEYYLYIYKP
jgi:hypothetical protein